MAFPAIFSPGPVGREAGISPGQIPPLTPFLTRLRSPDQHTSRRRSTIRSFYSSPSISFSSPPLVRPLLDFMVIGVSKPRAVLSAWWTVNPVTFVDWFTPLLLSHRPIKPISLSPSPLPPTPSLLKFSGMMDIYLKHSNVNIVLKEKCIEMLILYWRRNIERR